RSGTGHTAGGLLALRAGLGSGEGHSNRAAVAGQPRRGSDPARVLREPVPGRGGDRRAAGAAVGAPAAEPAAVAPAGRTDSRSACSPAPPCSSTSPTGRFIRI